MTIPMTCKKCGRVVGSLSSESSDRSSVVDNLDCDSHDAGTLEIERTSRFFRKYTCRRNYPETRTQSTWSGRLNRIPKPYRPAALNLGYEQVTIIDLNRKSPGA